MSAPNSEKKCEANPARIPPQTPPAGGYISRGRANPKPQKNCFALPSPFFRILNQDFVGKKFGFYSRDTAKFQNSFFRQNSERRTATRLEFPPEFAKGF